MTTGKNTRRKKGNGSCKKTSRKRKFSVGKWDKSLASMAAVQGVWELQAFHGSLSLSVVLALIFKWAFIYVGVAPADKPILRGTHF